MSCNDTIKSLTDCFHDFFGVHSGVVKSPISGSGCNDRLIVEYATLVSCCFRFR